MIITAALAWFDEAPEDLDKYVRALPGAVDRLVAVDGGYARYPGAAPRSPKEEAEAIRRACRDVGLPVEIVVPRRIWAGQVEKRNALVTRAAEGSDWIFTLDADHILHGVWEEFRHEVAQVVPFCHRIDLDFYTTMNYDRSLDDTSAVDWHRHHAGNHSRLGLLMRALPQIQYEKYHWWISALAPPTMRREWIYGGDETLPRHPHGHALGAPFFIEHRCHYRRDRNILANRVFCEDREFIVEETGQEDELPEVKAVA